MRNRNNSETSPGAQQVLDTDSDRYPTVKQALRLLQEDANCPNYQTDLIELRPQANGEVAWRVRPARSEEPDVGLASIENLR
jgi:hypothetical protein